LVEQEEKNLDEIAEEVCPSVEYGREKIIRVIKDFLGEEYLILHAETLGYDVGKAKLAKKRKQRSHKKIDAGTDSDAETNNEMPEACCQGTEKVVRKRQIVSDDGDSEEESSEQVEEPEINEFDELVGEIKRLIERFSLKEVKKAIAEAESDI
jgi:hypothetical protein